MPVSGALKQVSPTSCKGVAGLTFLLYLSIPKFIRNYENYYHSVFVFAISYNYQSSIGKS